MPSSACFLGARGTKRLEVGFFFVIVVGKGKGKRPGTKRREIGSE